MKQIIAISFAFWIGWAMCYFTKSEECYKQGYEAGKLFLRDSLIAETDSLLGCSQNGYLPDSIKTRNLPELKNGGSYKIKGKSCQ